MRKEILQTNKERLNSREVAQLLGKKWTELPIDKKQIYLEQAEHEKYKYAEEIKKFSGPTCLSKRMQMKITHNLEESKKKIKKPTNAYILFCNVQRMNLKKNQKMTLMDQNTYLAERWKEAADKIKAKFYAQARSEADLYKKRYNMKKPEMIKEILENMEKKTRRPLNAYICFCKEKLAGPDSNHKKNKLWRRDKMQEVAEKWQNMKNEDKLKYTKAAREANKQQEDEL